jgi:myo-inositol catabolism protein IolC
MKLGYNKPLYILPFDHRSSFEKNLYGWTGTLSKEQTEKIARTKDVIYDGFKVALRKGVRQENAGILVDAQFGERILRDCVKNGYITCLPAEKSGQAEFQFEYGDRYASVIEDYQPTFVKTLVRYNPEDDEPMNRRQAARLRELGEYLHSHGRYFMFELLVPATVEQMDRVEGDHAHYDRELRPSLMMGAIKELQGAGVEPDVWKIEGLDMREDCVKVAQVARRDGRDHVGCILLGRGSNAPAVIDWLKKAAGVPGFIGFAVGRTTFWEPIVAYRDGKATREQAAEQIADHYIAWVNVFKGAQSQK